VFYALFGLATMWRSLTWLFVSRIGAGLAGATISTTAAYIADVTSLEKRAKGMALIGAAFGLGFTFGPLLAAAALLSAGDNELSPAPGFVAAGLSAVAFILAIFLLPESLRPGAPAARRKLIDLAALRTALETPSIALLLLTSFISVLSFASFETTLALLISNPNGMALKLHQVSMYFAYIGVVLSLAQGVLVRRLADRVREERMATAGALVSIVGFATLAAASSQHGVGWLMLATAIEVTGFALMTPSLNSLISRRSDPAKQGGIMGVNQSVSALARITGPAAIPLFYIQPTLPYWVAAALMVAALFLVHAASRGGQDCAPVEGQEAA
jgi:MFS family permease